MIIDADLRGMINILILLIVILPFFCFALHAKTIANFLLKREELKQNGKKLDDDKKES
jgi:hypothetical protein